MKVLVPIDGSDCAKETLSWAARALDKQNTQYYLLYVVELGPGIAHDVYEVQDAQNFLQEGEELLKNQGCHVAKTNYVIGDPAGVICRYADEVQVDQVLMGSHGRTGLAKLLLGSVSSQVLEKSSKPVFVYRNVTR